MSRAGKATDQHEARHAGNGEQAVHAHSGKVPDAPRRAGRASRVCAGMPGMAPPPPDSRRPFLAVVALVLVVGMVVLLIVAL